MICFPVMKPTIGRIVIYTLPTGNDFRNNGAREAPAIIARVFDDGKINLRVFLDGSETPWATSVTEGTSPDTWHWPVIAKPEPTSIPGPGERR